MPKVADPEVRARLLGVAAHLIEAEGPASLTLRRVAAEVGTSTMAVYTHFGSMDELRQAVRAAGLASLAGNLAAIEATDDTVADLALTGVAYAMVAISSPHSYRAMFLDPLDDQAIVESLDVFAQFQGWVQRAFDAGRLTVGTPQAVAVQLWVVVHGVVTLHQSDRLGYDDAMRTFASLGRAVFVAAGDAPDAAQRSIDAAVARVGVELPPDL